MKIRHALLLVLSTGIVACSKGCNGVDSKDQDTQNIRSDIHAEELELGTSMMDEVDVNTADISSEDHLGNSGDRPATAEAETTSSPLKEDAADTSSKTHPSKADALSAAAGVVATRSSPKTKKSTTKTSGKTRPNQGGALSAAGIKSASPATHADSLNVETTSANTVAMPKPAPSMDNDTPLLPDQTSNPDLGKPFVDAPNSVEAPSAASSTEPTANNAEDASGNTVEQTSLAHDTDHLPDETPEQTASAKISPVTSSAGSPFYSEIAIHDMQTFKASGNNPPVRYQKREAFTLQLGGKIHSSFSLIGGLVAFSPSEARGRNASGTWDSETTFNGFTFGGRGHIPLSSALEAYIEGGWMHWNMDNKININRTDLGTRSSGSIDRYGNDPYWKLGLQHQLSDRTALGLSYTRFKQSDIYRGTSMDVDLEQSTLGLAIQIKM